jgi:hypothetical protein
MKTPTHTGLLVFAAAILVALGPVSACGIGQQTPNTSSTGTTAIATPSSAATTTPSVVQKPMSGSFVAELPPSGDKAGTTLALSFDGDKVVGYACDGKTDEAWFFGTQANGGMNLTSKYLDRLTAQYDGTKVILTLLINGNEYTGDAVLSNPPAGIYTATQGDARATWVVRSDQSSIGMLLPQDKHDREVINQINADKNVPEFQDKVRQARQAIVTAPAPKLTYGSWTSEIDGTPVTAVRVTGSMTSPPRTG